MRKEKHDDHGVVMHHVLGQGWVHTHGMDRHGLPELEVRGVPGFLAAAAADLLRHACDYMLASGKVMKAGEIVEVSPGTYYRLARPDPTPGDEGHYEVERLRLEDVQATCSCCGLPAGGHG